MFVGIDPPNNVKVTVLTPNIIEVSWDPIVSEEVSGYYVTYNTSATYASGNNITIHGYNVSKALLNSLEEDTLYNIHMQSISQNKVSGPSNVVSANTWTAGKYTTPYNCSYVRNYACTSFLSS